MEKELTITIPTEDGKMSYHIPEDGGVEIYNSETGELVMYLSRSPGYVYPLIRLLAERCSDLVTDQPNFAKYRNKVKESVGGITGQRPVVTSLRSINQQVGYLRRK